MVNPPNPQNPGSLPPRTHWLHGRFRSFGYAFRGLGYLIRREPNMQLHAIATVCAITTAILRHISTQRWAALVILIGLVWITEALNTAAERLCDLYSKEYNPLIKNIKDVAAGAVLVASITSVIAGILILFF